METVCFSRTVAFTDESTRRRNSEEYHHQRRPYRRENLKSQKFYRNPFSSSRVTTCVRTDGQTITKLAGLCLLLHWIAAISIQHRKCKEVNFTTVSSLSN
jgi:hypothetical protein